MPWLPVEIRKRPVLSVNWSTLRFNQVLGNILGRWPSVGVKVENGRPILAPADNGYGITYDPGEASGFLSFRAKPVFRAGRIAKDTKWVFVWEGKSMVGYQPEEAPPEAPSFEVIPTAELEAMRTELADLRRRVGDPA